MQEQIGLPSHERTVTAPAIDYSIPQFTSDQYFSRRCSIKSWASQGSIGYLSDYSIAAVSELDPYPFGNASFTSPLDEQTLHLTTDPNSFFKRTEKDVSLGLWYFARNDSVQGTNDRQPLFFNGPSSHERTIEGPATDHTIAQFISEQYFPRRCSLQGSSVLLSDVSISAVSHIYNDEENELSDNSNVNIKPASWPQTTNRQYNEDPMFITDINELEKWWNEADNFSITSSLSNLSEVSNASLATDVLDDISTSMNDCSSEVSCYSVESDIFGTNIESRSAHSYK